MSENMYERIGWKNHVVEYPLRRTIDDNGDGTYTVTPSPGEIIQQGTKQSAENFNHMDEGIYDNALAQKIYIQSRSLGGEGSVDFSKLLVTTDEDIKDFLESSSPELDELVATDDDIRNLFK